MPRTYSRGRKRNKAAKARKLFFIRKKMMESKTVEGQPKEGEQNPTIAENHQATLSEEEKKRILLKENKRILKITAEEQYCILCMKIKSVNTMTAIRNYANIVNRLVEVELVIPSIAPKACWSCFQTLVVVTKFYRQVLKGYSILEQKLIKIAAEESKVNESENKKSVEIDIKLPNVVNCEVQEESPAENTGNNLIKNEVDEVEMKENNIEIVPDNAIDSIDDNFTWSDSDSNMNKEEEISTNCAETNENVTINNSAIPCPSCGKLCRTMRCLESHMLFSHYPVEKTACPICGKMIINLLLDIHTHDTDIVDCKFCGKKMKRLSLNRHIYRLHSKAGMKMVLCQICGKYCNFKAFRRHSIIHGERKFKCHICDKAFHFPKYLERHIRSHSKEKPFTCNYCNRGFSCRWNLIQHKRLHTNTLPYKCHVCSAAFRHNVTLKKHLVTSHTAKELTETLPSTSAISTDT